jgi:siroheme synthase (precorrin-2 oxidase/ferrochelatase)
MRQLLPLFLHLQGRQVVLVGAGPVGASKLTQLLAAGATVRVVAPDVHPDVRSAGVRVEQRAFVPSDLDDAWLVVAAATPDVNRAVAEAAEARRILLREALDSVLPADLGEWMETARQARAGWRRDGVPMEQRRPLLLEALNQLYARRTGLEKELAGAGAAAGRPRTDEDR